MVSTWKGDRLGTPLAVGIMFLAHSGAVGWHTALQAEMPWVWFPMMSYEFFQPHYGPGIDAVSNRNEYQGYFLGHKGDKCIGLTTLPPSCAYWLDIWKPQTPGKLRACPGLYKYCLTFTLPRHHTPCLWLQLMNNCLLNILVPNISCQTTMYNQNNELCGVTRGFHICGIWQCHRVLRPWHSEGTNCLWSKRIWLPCDIVSFQKNGILGYTTVKSSKFAQYNIIVGMQKRNAVFEDT